MEYNEAFKIATEVKELLSPFCERIQIAGSIRREKPEVKDIEIVAIPKPYEIGIFESGIATVVNRWQKIKGELPCKYTQRMLPQGIVLDLFFAEPINWGYILAIRTGSAEYSHNTLAKGWVKNGYKGEDGYLKIRSENRVVEVREEIELFKRAGVRFVLPQFRK